MHWRHRDRVTRQHVLDAAAALFEERGFDSTRVEDIASALGISGPTLYSRTTGKEELWRAILDQVIAALDAEAKESVAWEGPPIAALESVFRHHLGQSLRYRSYFNAFFNDRRQSPSRGADGFGSWAAAYSRRVAGLIAAGQAAGDIRGELDPDLAGAGLIAVANWPPRWFRDGSRLDVEAVVAGSWRLVANGLLRTAEPLPSVGAILVGPAAHDGSGEVQRFKGRAPVSKDKILNAAASLFDAHGFHGASTAGIATKAGISKPTLYSRVSGKDGLLEAVVEQLMLEFDAGPNRCLASEGGVVEQLGSFFGAHVRYATQRPALVNVFLSEQRHLSAATAERCRDWSRKLIASLREAIALGQTSGEVRPDVDPFLAAVSLLAVANWTARWYRPDRRRTPSAVAAASWQFIAGGLASDSA